MKDSIAYFKLSPYYFKNFIEENMFVLFMCKILKI